MKQNIIMAAILVVLFVFGLLIYDFSDAVDSKITNNDWYLVKDNEINVLNFKDGIFSYKDMGGKLIDEYKTCTSYYFNKSINVLKLNCKMPYNKIYIDSFSETELKLKFNGENVTLYSNLEQARIEQFKAINELNSEDYDKLLNVNFDNYNIIMVSDIEKLLKSKKESIIIFGSKMVSYLNVYNYVVLNNLLKDTTKNYYFVDIENLTDNEEKLLKEFNYDKEKVIIYRVSDKLKKRIVEIRASLKSDLASYVDISL